MFLLFTQIHLRNKLKMGRAIVGLTLLLLMLHTNSFNPCPVPFNWCGRSFSKPRETDSRRIYFTPLKSSVTDDPPTASERLQKARNLLNEYSRDFTPPPQFLLPSEPPTLDEDAVGGTASDSVSSSLVPIDVIDIDITEPSTSPSARTQQKVSSRWENGVKVATPIKTYEPNLSSSRYLKKPLIWLRRNFEIALPLAKWSSGLIFDLATGKVVEREQVSDVEKTS